jgi:hypothetical protein
MVWFEPTGYCIMANGLYWLGDEPRLSPAGKPAPASRVPGREAPAGEAEPPASLA